MIKYAIWSIWKVNNAKMFVRNLLFPACGVGRRVYYVLYYRLQTWIYRSCVVCKVKAGTTIRGAYQCSGQWHRPRAGARGRRRRGNYHNLQLITARQWPPPAPVACLPCLSALRTANVIKFYKVLLFVTFKVQTFIDVNFLMELKLVLSLRNATCLFLHCCLLHIPVNYIITTSLLYITQQANCWLLICKLLCTYSMKVLGNLA